MVTFTTSPELIAYDNAITTMENHVQSMLAQEKDEWVWFCEHPPLYTGGTSAKDSDLLQPKFPVFQTGRGGEYTYHGPGQRIAYVMLNLKKRKAQDVKSYVCTLEQWLINTLKHFDVDGQRRQGRVGIWVIDKQGKECKIAAMGIRIKRWVTFHGIALNINPDLSHYNGIVPCGIKDYGVTSLAALGIDVSMEDVDHILTQEFMALFAQN